MTTNVGGGGYLPTTPQVLSAAASQTERPELTRQTNVGGGGYQPTNSQVFDMALDDNVDAMMDDIQAVSDQQAQQVEQRCDNIIRILQSH